MKEPSLDKHPAFEREHIPVIVWGLLVAFLLLAAAVGTGGLYLKNLNTTTAHHQQLSDLRAERERVAICNILDQFPPGANPQLDNARKVYACTFAERAPSPAPTLPPSPAPKRHPRPRVTVTEPPQVITRTGPTRLVVTPGPTVTVTKHPKPRPTPTCSSLRVNGMCVPIPPLHTPGRH